MATITLQQAFDLAVQHHHAGRLPEAEDLYRQILVQQPAHAGALHYLGVIARRVGRADIGIELIRRALALQPGNPEAHYNLGVALKESGHIQEAIAAYRSAIALKPDFAAAFCNLGELLIGIGQLDDAEAALRQAIALAPRFYEAHSNLGNALRGKQRLQEAIASHRQALAIKPDCAELYCNMAAALKESGQLDAAIAACSKAIALRGDYAEAYNNLSAALTEAGRFDEAIAASRQAVALRPRSAEAHLNLGSALRAKGKINEAIDCFRRAIDLRPDFSEARINLGAALKDRGQLDEAIAAYRQALALNADDALAHSNLLYALPFHPRFAAGAIAQEHRLWNQLHAQPLRPTHLDFANDRSADRRVRIGYLSPDFDRHCQSLFTIPLLSHHDHSAFEVWCYSDVLCPDDCTRRIAGYADRWRELHGLDDAAVAETIRADGIDILVNLTMHMANGRPLLFSRKPAPVQVAWLAYPGTTGMSAMDYRISDPYLDPPGCDESLYSEKTIRLPDSFWCYDPVEERDVGVGSLPALANGFVTFGCLNNFCKVNDDILSLWAQVLGKMPNSRLKLLAPMGSHRQRTLEQFAQRGIDATRIEFHPHQSRRAYLESYHRIDIGLDMFPYNGHTTSLDSFWMGVPVVTLIGATVVGRAGFCQLSNLGMPELAAQTPEQFVGIATELAADLGKLAQLRSTLRQRIEQSPLMDAPRFARNMEVAYRQMWRTWCESPLAAK